MFALNVAILVFNISFSQSEKKFFFKEIGWSITIPEGFEVLNSAASSKLSEDGIKLIEKANDFSVDTSSLKNLFTAKNEAINTFFLLIKDYINKYRYPAIASDKITFLMSTIFIMRLGFKNIDTTEN